jgi:RNA polymerase sigma-70 factor (ECF subfamily)
MTLEGLATEGRAAAGSPSDAEVVRRVLAGETALFELLMRRHDQRVYRAVRSILRDDAEAEDAMQQAWLLAWSSLPHFQGTAAFSTWLVRIAVNEALGRARRRARGLAAVSLVGTAEGVMSVPDVSPEERAAGAESRRLLERSIDRLPQPYRTVFVLREVEQLSTADTAEALGLSEDAVKVRLHRARLALRDALAEEVGAGAPEAFQFLAPRCNRLVAAVMAQILDARR